MNQIKLPRTEMINARNELDLSQQELAKLTGVSRAYIVNIEAGRYTPSLDVARKISSALNKSIEEIFFRLDVQKTNEKKIHSA